MNQRTKWLAVGACVVFGLYGIDRTYRSQIEEPSTRLNADLDRLTSELTASRDAQIIAKKVNQRLDSYQARALPYEPQLARSAYQRWLLKLVEQHGIESAAVDAAQPRPVEIRSRTERRKRIQVGSTIQFSMRGQGTLAQWTGLIYDFRQAGHLHKVRSLVLNPLGSEGKLDANLTIEVLSLVGATRKEELSGWQMVSESQPPREVYGELVRRNLFARGFSKVLSDIRLKAITYDRAGQAEAWFQIDQRGSTVSTRPLQQLPVALHDISVMEVNQSKVLVQVNGDSYWIALGESIGEVCNGNIEK